MPSAGKAAVQQESVSCSQTVLTAPRDTARSLLALPLGQRAPCPSLRAEPAPCRTRGSLQISLKTLTFLRYLKFPRGKGSVLGLHGSGAAGTEEMCSEPLVL